MDGVNKPPTHSSKNLFVFGLGVISVVLLAAAVYLFMNVQSLTSENQTLTNQQTLLQTQVAGLKDEKAQLEKELIFYKNTDLAKELEIGNLKLKTAEEKLAETQQSLKTEEATHAKLRSDVNIIPKRTNILAMMLDTTYGPDCFSDADKAKTREALKALGDSMWLEKWETFANDAKSQQCTMSPMLFKDALDYGLTKISEAVK